MSWSRSRRQSSTSRCLAAPTRPLRPIPATPMTASSSWTARRSIRTSRPGFTRTAPSRQRPTYLLETRTLMLEILLTLSRIFRDAGYELYMVGGAVRDLLLRRDAALDIDLATNARPD